MVRKIGVLLWGRVLVQEIAELAKCFEMANLLAQREIYQIATFALSSGEVFNFGTWLTCSATYGVEDLPQDIDVVLIPPTDRNSSATIDQAYRQYFTSRTDIGRVCAWGNGVVLAASCGLAGGRQIAAEAADVPNIMHLEKKAAIQPFAENCRSGPLSTWAGTAKARSIVLSLAEEDFGIPFAQELARRLGVVERMEKVVTEAKNIRRNSPVDRVRQWVKENPRSDLSVGSLAKMVSMSEKTLSRAFKDKTGQTLGGFVLGVRLDHACSLLATTDRKIKEIAQLSGLGSQANMRQAFMTKFGQSPTGYRARLVGDDLDNAIFPAHT